MKKTALFLAALGIAAGNPIGTAWAFQPPPGVAEQWNYYSDPGMQNLIGQYRLYCDDHTASWGGISEYSYVDYYNC